VRAFYRRSLYDNVLRERSQSQQITAALKVGSSGPYQDVIDLSAEHEALSHPGLSDGSLNHVKSWAGKGPVSEGVNNYALWRKKGALNLPVHASDPEGFPTDFATFEPKS